MKILSWLGALSPFHIQWVTLTRGKKVGQDQFGNRYYRAPARKHYAHERRWVVYKGAAEASYIPPEWHAWMHHQTNDIPTEDGPSYRKPWQKAHQPNMTGSDKAYRPEGSLLRTGKRPAATGDYEAWTP